MLVPLAPSIAHRVAWFDDGTDDWKLFHTPVDPGAGGGGGGNSAGADVLYRTSLDLWEQLAPPAFPVVFGDPNAALYSARAATLRDKIHTLLGI